MNMEAVFSSETSDSSNYMASQCSRRHSDAVLTVVIMITFYDMTQVTPVMFAEEAGAKQGAVVFGACYFA
jgi:hypothetical protein